MKILNHKGNILLFAIVAFTFISVLGTGIYFMTTSAIFSGLSANQQNRAYQLAVAGRDYALAKNMTAANSGDFTMSNGDIFRLVICNQIDKISSTGIVGNGTPYEAKRTIDVTITGFCSRADIEGTAGFPTAPPTAQAGFLSVDQTAAQISLGQLQASKFGSVWYSGTSALGNCQDGECDFGTGFRTYFMFKLAWSGSTNYPHGFTFAVFNGTDNSSSSAGGDVAMPELLAYGGNSCTTGSGSGCTSWLVNESDRGIKPPKMSLEFDGRPNTGYADFCPPLSRPDSLSREDGSRTHMAYVFWGDNTDNAKCSNRENSLTYDDNRHGAGASTDPVNAISTDASDTLDYFIGSTPFWSADWLYNTTKVYAVRIEVKRASILNSNGKYFYTVNTWIKRCSSDNISDPTACSEFVNFSNTKVAYNPTPADLPTLKRTIELAPAFHSKFNKFLFGWTAAAGSASRENLTLKNFQLYFAREPTSCGGYGVWNNLGVPRYFAINGTGCVIKPNGSLIGNIGPSVTIKGYTDAACASATSPSELTYSQAAVADTNTNCAVYFDGTDK